MATTTTTKTTSSSSSNGGLGTKKSVFVLITVVGCIAILWPKILYFAMFGGQQTNKVFVKDHRNNVAAGLRQERPPQFRPDGIHPAMRERGRAIPATATVPIVLPEDKPIPPTAPRIVEGRPGPIPGMRPPLGAGSNHQANHKGNSLGFIMPLYTVGIVAFFVYTIMKLVMKKPISNPPYTEAIKSNHEFQDQVFGNDKSVVKKGEPILTNIGWNDHDTRWHANGNSRNAVDLYTANNLHRAPNESELEFQMRETEQLLEISLLKKKLLETEQAMSRIIADMGSIAKGQDITDICGNGNGNLHATNGNLKVSPQDSANGNGTEDEEVLQNLNKKVKNLENGSTKSTDLKTKDPYNDKSVKVLGMETTESCEGGRKWLRPSTPLYHAATDEKPVAEPQSIFLEGSLPHDSQILVTDSETKTEKMFDDELDDSKEEPAVVICSKMTLSLINMDPVDKNGRNASNDVIDDEIDEDDEAEIEDEDIEEIEEIEEIEDEEVEEIENEEEDERAIAKGTEVNVTNDKAKPNGKVDKVEDESEEEVEYEEEEEVEEEEDEEVVEEEEEEEKKEHKELQS